MNRSLLPRVAALLGLAAAASAQGFAWKEGAPLPPLRLPTVDGSRTVELSELRGTKLLLIEFASW